MSQMFGVYRQFKNGNLKYVSRSVTANEGLAKDIASGLTRGEVVMPDGSIKQVRPFPHVVRPITTKD